MLNYLNNTAQSVAEQVDTVDYDITAADGTPTVPAGTAALAAQAALPSSTCTAAA
jgi:hypothetical protein